ncbi:4'-phosphopantetheinyl transferase superfamily protein [Kribbella sp. NPDC048915]|uniref:4'-phosphopantetheinyl transferase family protein n=1 Tax=Kribbella sp. NPDC048915 TaxID=3155148 RepID=UPI0033D5F96E
MGSCVYVAVRPAGGEARRIGQNLIQALAEPMVGRAGLSRDDTGRPRVEGLAVSVSYSEHQVAVAVGYDGPLGIDLEEVRPREFRALAQRWFGQRELDWMAEQPDELTGFLQLWTAKEAVGKALGTGLNDGGLQREMPLGGGPVEAAPGLAVTYLSCPNAVLALAAPADVTIEYMSIDHGNCPPGVTGA